MSDDDLNMNEAEFTKAVFFSSDADFAAEKARTDQVLAERAARTSGAVEQARGAIAAAEAETSVYEEKLRAAKSEIFQAREQKLKQWNAERDRAVEQARQATQEQIKAARQEIEQSSSTARLQIEGMSLELSAQILKAVLPEGIAAPEVMQ
jgi:F-type H+-transporting ATPase subunit b